MDTVSNDPFNPEKSQLSFKRSGIIVLGQWVSLLQQPKPIPASCVGFVQQADSWTLTTLRWRLVLLSAGDALLRCFYRHHYLLRSSERQLFPLNFLAWDISARDSQVNLWNVSWTIDFMLLTVEKVTFKKVKTILFRYYKTEHYPLF